MRNTYTVHHENARAASRRLSIWFWSGVILSFFSYTLVSWAFLATLFYLFARVPQNLFPFALIIGLATCACVIYGYARARRDAARETAAERATALGASPLDTPAHPAEHQYRNIVQEMAVAAGIPPPDIHILRHDMSINAFVIGGAHGSTALAVSAGALSYLDRDELQALTAHEFGHIANGDLPLYGRLTAMIHGYRYIVELAENLFDHEKPALNLREQMLIQQAEVENDIRAQAVRQLAYAAATRRLEEAQSPESGRTALPGALFSALLLTLSAYSGLLIAYARLMQAAIARQREWMADAKAVQFTRNGQALAGVFKKVLAIQHLDQTAYRVAVENRHLLLINYLQKHGSKRHHTHPDTLERLKRYGDYRQEDIESLAYALRDRPRYDQPPRTERSQTHFADALFPFMLLRHHATLALPPLDNRAIVLTALMRLANATPKGLLHSGKLDPDTLRATLPAWQALLPAHQASFLPVYLKHLGKLDDTQAAALPILPIIHADGALSLSEWCAKTAWLARTTPPDSQPLEHRAAEPHIRTILRLAAHLAGQDETTRARHFADLPRHTLPIAPTPWQSVQLQRITPVPCKAPDEPGWPIEPINIPDEHERARARTAILTLRQLRPVYRQSLIHGLQHSLRASEPLPLDAFNYLLLLEHLLDTNT